MAERFFGARNDATRIDVFEELNPIALAALRSFFRRLGAPHLVDEDLLPTLDEGDARIYAAVRDRPWPPWGLGARHVTAVCQVQAIADESYAISPVYVTDEDATNVGLQAALYKEVLEAIVVGRDAEVNYLVAEGSVLAPHVLTSLGFKRYEDVFLTESGRYYTYRIPAAALLETLNLVDVDTPELLAHQIPEEALAKHALFHSTILLGSRAEWIGQGGIAEIIRLARGGHASKPGGVPSGTSRWGWQERLERVFISLENFLGDARPQLLDFVMAHEPEFRQSTILPPGEEQGHVDERLRRSRTLDRLESFEPMFAERIREVIGPVLTRLDLPAFPLGRIEMQVTASNDGDFFRMHRDDDGTTTRELTFVYFFHREPRRFSGGELRIFDNDIVDGRIVPTDRSQTLSPRQDVMVFFPAHNEHEVLPVRVPSKAFGDSRFTVNGWVHRAEK